MNHPQNKHITSWTVERIKSLDDDSFCSEARAFLMYAKSRKGELSEEELRHIIQQTEQINAELDRREKRKKGFFRLWGK
jgi:hypothetical protein|nr:MAG TPA: hypothetical protein [Caudoviricetes sp.]